MFHMALARIWKFIHHVNVYFHANEPWKLVRSDLKCLSKSYLQHATVYVS